MEFVSESDTVPNTWSYTESQLQMPNQSIDSRELAMNQLIARSDDPLSASAVPPIHYGSQINYIVKEKEQVSDDYGCEVRQPWPGAKNLYDLKISKNLRDLSGDHHDFSA